MSFVVILTPKQLGTWFQNMIFFPNVVHYRYNICALNRCCIMNNWPMVWYLQALEAIMLHQLLCVSSCLGVKHILLSKIYLLYYKPLRLKSCMPSNTRKPLHKASGDLTIKCLAKLQHWMFNSLFQHILWHLWPLYSDSQVQMNVNNLRISPLLES